MHPYSNFARFTKPYSQVTKWSRIEMKSLAWVIGPVFVATLWHPSESQRIPFTDTLLGVHYLAYLHLIAQYRYHTQAMIDFIQNCPEKLHCPKDVFSSFCTSQSTLMVSEALTTQYTLDQLEEYESDPGWNNHSVTAKWWRVNEDADRVRKFDNIFLPNRISLFGIWISGPMSLTISASVTTSHMQALNSQIQ